MSLPSRLTRAVRSGIATDPGHRDVIPPVHLSTNFAFEGIDGRPDHDYSRSGNPTRDVLADALATLEGGASAVATSSGMAAVTTLVMSVVGPGGRVIAPHDAYGGSLRLFRTLAARGWFTLDVVDLTDTDAATAHIAGTSPDLVWVETPSNPLLRITDIAAVADATRAAGGHVAVDNTFCTPLLQRPLELGAHSVVHSTTKYVNGHSDVIGGAVVAGEAGLGEELAVTANSLGTTAGAFDSWLTMRGLRTLPARMRVHQDNAAVIVDALSRHRGVRAVHHPGLPDHPGHDLAARQQSGFGAMLSFELRDRSAVDRALEGLTCFTLAESLGGTESLVCHPATMTHASMSPEAQAAAGITDGLIRMSVGLEEADDLVADLLEALDRAA
ncbi:O-succinylhomoserine (thiol)-lyase [Mariniluteicoccus endophyticus]